jgi:hypothetical protein
MDDDFDDEEPSEEERSAEVRTALLKALGIVVALGVVIAIGTMLMVGALGLDDDESTGPVGAVPSPTQPLPTTALPVPGETESSATEEPTDLVTPDDAAKGPIQLSVSPVLARPMERVNLTGTYPGRDSVGLKVQRFEDGQWSDFGVSATVRVGTFETYVMTGRSGENRFRMFDPETDKGSNVVLVTID